MLSVHLIEIMEIAFQLKTFSIPVLQVKLYLEQVVGVDFFGNHERLKGREGGI